MKIAVIGNCQAGIMRPCIEFLAAADAEHMSHSDAQAAFAQAPEVLAARLDQFDLVLTQSFGPSNPGRLGTDDIRAMSKRCITLPNLHFPAFHPDLIYAQTGQNENVLTPLGPYNSAIILFAFKSGFTQAETMSLFRRDVFKLLGYLDMWAHSQADFFGQCTALNFPGREAFASWTRQGNFLHTINHPKIFVIEDMARIALRMAGVKCRPDRCSDYIHDGLLDAVWPVYPDVAALYSIAGSYTFRRASHQGPLVDKYPLYMELDAFVAGSFECYARHEDTLSAQRVDRWLADPRIVENARAA